MLLDAKAFQAAEQVYKYGQYSTNSLQDLARGTLSSLNETAIFEAFSSYYSNDFYSDALVLNTMHDGVFRPGSSSIELSDEERRILVVGFSQMVILPHAAFGFMRAAWSACRDLGARNEAMDDWDRAAALLLGSGRLSPYDLGQSNCKSFGTCDAKTGVAESNRMMLDLLYAGKGALAHDNGTFSTKNNSQCDVLIKQAKKIQAVVLVPIIQATLKSAFDAGQERTSEAMAGAVVASGAILPLIQELNPNIASKLSESLDLRKQSQVPANPGAVVMDLLSQVYEGLNIDCDWIGRLEHYNPCESNNTNLYASAPKQGLSTAGLVAIILSIVITMIIVYFWWVKKRAQKRRRCTNVGMVVDSKPTVETYPNDEHGDRDFDDDECPRPLSSSLSTTSRNGSLSSMVGKSPRPSESTVDKSNIQMIRNSFQRCTQRLSSKADRTLNRIMSYGDDDESAAVDEEWVLQRKMSPKESGSLTGVVIPEGSSDDEILS